MLTLVDLNRESATAEFQLPLVSRPEKLRIGVRFDGIRRADYLLGLLPGDVTSISAMTNTTVVNTADLNFLAGSYAASPPRLLMDFNLDGLVSAMDAPFIQGAIDRGEITLPVGNVPALSE